LYMHCTCSCWKKLKWHLLRAYVEQVEQVEVEETLKSLFIAVIGFASFVSSFVSPHNLSNVWGMLGRMAGGGCHSTSTAELKAILARRCKEDGCGLHCWFGRGELYVCLWFVSKIIAGFGVVWDNHLTRGSLQSSAAMMKRPPQLKYVEMIVKDNIWWQKCCQTNFSMGSMKQKFKQREGYAKSVAQADTVAKWKSLTNTAHGCHCREQRLCRDN
jgi:hypothetical protein